MSSIEKKPAAQRLRFETFRAILKSWDEVFQEAADFATSVGQKR